MAKSARDVRIGKITTGFQTQNKKETSLQVAAGDRWSPRFNLAAQNGPVFSGMGAIVKWSVPSDCR